MAGEDLEDSQDLRAGTLLTLPAGIEHEVTPETSLHMIVIKFKAGKSELSQGKPRENSQ